MSGFFSPQIGFGKEEIMLTVLSSLISAIKNNLSSVIVSLAIVFVIILILQFLEILFSKKSEEIPVSRVSYMTSIALLSAVAGILMLFEFPLPFIAPGFYKVDLSEVPVVVGAFALGPVAGVLIEFVKIIINLFVNGTTTAFIGEMANFLIGIAFVIPASMVYYLKRNKKKAIIGLIYGTFFTTITGVLLNAYVLLPFYAAAFGGMENIVAAGTAVNPAINSVFTFCMIAVAPFNLIKFSVVSVISLSVYGSVLRVIKR